MKRTLKKALLKLKAGIDINEEMYPKNFGHPKVQKILRRTNHVISEADPNEEQVDNIVQNPGQQVPDQVQSE